MSAYEHGQNAANKGEHIQACPFDTGTPQWHEWRDGFMVGLVEYHARTLANIISVNRLSLS